MNQKSVFSQSSVSNYFSFILKILGSDLLMSWRCNARSSQCQDCYSPPGNDALLWWLYWTRKGWFRLQWPPTEAHMENLSSASLWYQDNANRDMKWTTKTVWIVTMQRRLECLGAGWEQGRVDTPTWGRWDTSDNESGNWKHGSSGPPLGCISQGLGCQLSFWCVWFRIFLTCFYDV